MRMFWSGLAALLLVASWAPAARATTYTYEGYILSEDYKSWEFIYPTIGLDGVPYFPPWQYTIEVDNAGNPVTSLQYADFQNLNFFGGTDYSGGTWNNYYLINIGLMSFTEMYYPDLTITGVVTAIYKDGTAIIKNGAVVPLPAALPLLGGAFLLLGLVGWRRNVRHQIPS